MRLSHARSSSSSNITNNGDIESFEYYVSCVYYEIFNLKKLKKIGEVNFGGDRDQSKLSRLSFPHTLRVTRYEYTPILRYHPYERDVCFPKQFTLRTTNQMNGSQRESRSRI